MKIILSKDAKKVLDAIQTDRQVQIKEALKKLPDGDVKALKGKREPYKRLRIGGYRVIFKEKDGEIYITKIKTRGDVYKGGL